MLTYSTALKRVLNFARKKTNIVKVEKSLQHVCVRNINSKKNNPFLIIVYSMDLLLNHLIQYLIKVLKFWVQLQLVKKIKLNTKKIVVIELVQAQRYFIHITV